MSDALAKLRGRAGRIIPFSLVGAIVLFGAVSTALLITTNMTSAQSAALAYASDYLRKNENGHEITTLSGPAYSWILRDMYRHENVSRDYSMILFQRIRTDNTLLIADSHFMIDISRGRQLQDAYNQSHVIGTFESQVFDYDSRKYPFTSMNFNREGGKIEVRTE